MNHCAKLALLLGLFSAGCASAPEIDYYTLDMARSNNAAPAVNLVVEHLRLADKLRRDGIYIQTGPTQADYYANHAWAAGLDELIIDKLTTEFGLAPDAPKVRVLVNVLEFGQQDTPTGPLAHAKLQVSFLSPEQKRYEAPVEERVYEQFVTPRDDTPVAVTEALSEALEVVAGEIVADAGGLV